MKEYLLLYRLKLDHYVSLDKKYKHISLSVLKFVLSSDFRPNEEDFLNQVVSCYNVSFIYHDFENNMLYVGRADWELDEEIACPSDDEFPHYVNDTNSCRMTVNNYLEFRKQWMQLKQDLFPFALIYRENNDWVDCKGFETQQEMEAFVQQNQQEIIH